MLRRFLFVPVLLLSVATVAILVALGPEPEAQEIETPLTEVHVQTVELGAHRVVVSADGTAGPARRTTVSAQTAGEVIWAADALRIGAQVAAEAPLFRIRRAPYEQALAQARSAVAEAELRVLRERAGADLARSEWDGAGMAPDPLALRLPQLAAAEEAASAARAALERAEEDLNPTSPLLRVGPASRAEGSSNRPPKSAQSGH